MGALNIFARNVNVSREVNLCVYNEELVPCLMYGIECWVWDSKNKIRMNIVLRSVCRVTRMDRVRNKLAYEECEISENVVNRVASSHLRWF